MTPQHPRIIRNLLAELDASPSLLRAERGDAEGGAAGDVRELGEEAEGGGGGDWTGAFRGLHIGGALRAIVGFRPSIEGCEECCVREAGWMQVECFWHCISLRLRFKLH